MRAPRTKSRRLGTAAVELAVVVPFLTVCAYGMIEVSRAVQVKHYLTDAARSGCRLAATPGKNNAQVKAMVNAVLENHGLPTADATITIQVNDKSADVKTGTTGDKVSVRVALPVTKVNWMAPYIFPSSAVESDDLVMMKSR